MNTTEIEKIVEQKVKALLAGNKKISELNPVNPLVGTEVAPVVQAGETKKVSIDEINDFISQSITRQIAYDGGNEVQQILNRFATNHSGAVKVSSVSLNTAGTGYTAGQLYYIVGGTTVAPAEIKQRAVIRIDTVGGGGTISAFALVYVGAYQVAPPVGASLLLIGPGVSGSGGTVNPVLNLSAITTSVEDTRVSILGNLNVGDFLTYDPTLIARFQAGNRAVGMPVFNDIAVAAMKLLGVRDGASGFHSNGAGVDFFNNLDRFRKYTDDTVILSSNRAALRSDVGNVVTNFTTPHNYTLPASTDVTTIRDNESLYLLDAEGFGITLNPGAGVTINSSVASISITNGFGILQKLNSTQYWFTLITADLQQAYDRGDGEIQLTDLKPLVIKSFYSSVSDTVSVAFGGAGYSAGQFIKPAGGTSSQTAIFQITGAPGGAIAALALVPPFSQKGIYSANPSPLLSNPVVNCDSSGNTIAGTGSGALINFSMEPSSMFFFKADGSGMKVDASYGYIEFPKVRIGQEEKIPTTEGSAQYLDETGYFHGNTIHGKLKFLMENIPASQNGMVYISDNSDPSGQKWSSDIIYHTAEEIMEVNNAIGINRLSTTFDANFFGSPGTFNTVINTAHENNPSGIVHMSYGDNSSPALFLIGKGQGTIDSPLPDETSELVGFLGGVGVNTSLENIIGAAIVFQVFSDPTATDCPLSIIMLSLNADNGSSTIFQLNPNGDVVLSGSDPLEIGGNLDIIFGKGIAMQAPKIEFTTPNLTHNGNPVSSNMFTQTGSFNLQGTAVKTAINTTGVGTLTIPANTLNPGDSFSLTLAGVYRTNQSIPNDQIALSLESAGIVLASTPNFIVKNQIGNVGYSVYITFTVESIGAAGVASLKAIIDPSSLASSSLTTNFYTGNSTTFDTTIDLTLDLYGQWNNAGGNNLLNSSILTLIRN